MAEILAEQLAKFLGKKVATAAVRTGVLCLIDGPLPIGDAIAAIWGLYDVASAAHKVLQLKNIHSILNGALSDKLSGIFDNPDVFGCLEKNGKCCQRAKKMIADLLDGVKPILQSYNKRKRFKMIGDLTKDVLGDGIKDIKKCCDYTPCERKPFSEGTREKIKNRDKMICQNCSIKTKPSVQCKPGVRPPGDSCEIDHIVRCRDGGGNDEGNGRVLCRDCNQLREKPGIDF